MIFLATTTLILHISGHLLASLSSHLPGWLTNLVSFFSSKNYSQQYFSMKVISASEDISINHGANGQKLYFYLMSTISSLPSSSNFLLVLCRDLWTCLQG